MSKTLIFGHKNPDSDSICSSIAYSLFKKELGENVEVVRLGNINKETEFVLNYLNLEAPRMIDIVDDNQDVIMIDHNEFNQSVDNIEKANILEVIDHHRVDNFRTSTPLEMTLRPVGCSATIIYEKMCNMDFVPNQIIATLLCSAIISDSLLFKSPTCTERDKQACLELANIAGICVDEYGMDMLRAGTDLDDFSCEELISIDSKTFDTNDGKINVSQVNTVDIDQVLKREVEIKEALSLRLRNEELAQCILMITDIMQGSSMCIVIGDEDKFEKKFNVSLVQGKALLPGVLSRKKQIVPFL